MIGDCFLSLCVYTVEGHWAFECPWPLGTGVLVSDHFRELPFIVALAIEYDLHNVFLSTFLWSPIESNSFFLGLSSTSENESKISSEDLYFPIVLG